MVLGEPLKVEDERVLVRVAADAVQAEVVHEAAIEAGDAVTHIPAPVVRGHRGGNRAPHRQQAERLRRLDHALVREHLHVRGMGHRQELQAVEVDHLLQLVRDPQLEAAVLRAELVGANANVLLGIGDVPQPGGEPVPHLAPAQEVAHELEALAVPGVEVGAGRRLPIQLRHVQGGAPAPGRRGGKVGLGLDDPRDPDHADRVGRRALSQAEHEVRRSHGGSCGRGLELLAQAARSDIDLRSHPALVRDPARKAQGEGAVRVAAVVAQVAQGRRRGQENVLVAIAVEVRDGEGRSG